MTFSMQDLYQEMILDHNKSPRNFRELPESNREAKGDNPLCGDKVTVFLTVDDDIIEDVGFKGSGCAISTASASVMTEMIKGKTVSEVEELFERFRRLVTQNSDVSPDLDELGKLAAFSGVIQYPTRVKCATLAWHTLHAALANKEQPVSTE